MARSPSSSPGSGAVPGPRCRTVPRCQTAIRERPTQLRVLSGGGGRRTWVPVPGSGRCSPPERLRDGSSSSAGATQRRRRGTTGSGRGGVVPPLDTSTRLDQTEDPLAGIERRPQPRDDTAPIRYEQLHALWTRADIHVREKTLWRMLYETAARANEILALNVEDLDLGARRAVVRGKGGHRQEVVWASGTARLLPRYLAGRQSRAAVFVTHRQPNQAPALPDLCPDTGRGRLSYQQAWALFRNASGWTLHQLRHSALTHLGERGVGAPLLKAKSRHRSLRSLDRYVRPGIEAVAALTAEHDPGRRYPTGR